MTFAPTLCAAGFGLTLVTATELGYLELGFCACTDKRWSEGAPQSSHGSSLRKWVFASKVSFARTPRALVQPQLLCLHGFVEQEKNWI